jgi:serine/threonine protein kinase
MGADYDYVESVFSAAVATGGPAERARYLDSACGGDADLRRKVEALLASHDGASRFLSRPLDHGGVFGAGPGMSVAEASGAQIGPYRLLELVGEGGFGSVFMAEQEHPVRRTVALKIIKLGMDTRQVIARFEAERQALALMDHPNIARVLDAGATDTGRPYFVMELVRGVTITEYCDTNNLSTAGRLELFIPVCHAIQHAHQKGVIHRDIKPSNILVTLHDGVPVPKVIDFGIAKATQQELTDKTLFTQFQQFIGTPAYISPEQAETSGLDIDTRADIYSLGVLLYELLVGQTPFDAKEMMQAGLDGMRKIIREKEPLRPSTKLSTLQGDARAAAGKRRQADVGRLVHQVRGDLDWIVMKCLEKDRTRRYDTANGLAMDIRRHLDNEPVIARPSSAAYKLHKAWRRNRLAFSAAAAVLCVLIAGAVVSTWQAVRATRAEREQSRLRQDAEGLRAAEAGLRREAQNARGQEATLRQEAEVREQLVKAQVLCDQLQIAQAEELMSRIPDSALHTAGRDAAIVFTELADYHARRLRWNEALPHAVKALECEPHHLNYYPIIVILAAQGDVENYRRYCREALDRCGEIVNGEGLAKVCLMLPSSGVDLALTDVMADRGLISRINSRDPYISYSQFAKGLADYRQGRYSNAADWTRKSIADPFYGAGHSRYVQSYMVLAMAEHQLNEHEEARAAFARGSELEQTKLRKVDSGDLGAGWYWRDWVIAHALMNEARALMEGRSSTAIGVTQK